MLIHCELSNIGSTKLRSMCSVNPLNALACQSRSILSLSIASTAMFSQRTSVLYLLSQQNILERFVHFQIMDVLFFLNAVCSYRKLPSEFP